MAELNSRLHLDMLRSSTQQRPLRSRILDFFRADPMRKKIYGLEWGDPETFEPLRFVRDRYLLPYVNSEKVALEIGPGGGRWTRYLLPCRRLYVVDYHQELLDELRRTFHSANMVFVRTNGCDFPGILEQSVDFVFSFGTFVHLDADIISGYLQSIHSILRPGGNFVLNYSDKTKIMARENRGFSENTPEKMRRMVSDAGFAILEEDLTTLWHSSVMRVTV